MPCYHPLKGYYGRKTNPETGKRAIVFSAREGYYDAPVALPCGRCIGCRLERSRQWATRCVHEASLYPQNCFLTLTFREACPIDGTKTDPTQSLHKHHFQRFMKRVRKHFFGNSKGTIRYFHCGEYGETLGRPHHHACLFNIDFPDKTLWSIRDGVRLYESKTLEKLWPHGSCKIGDVTFDSAAYVARYVVKKITGAPAKDHYKGKLPEYCTMSRRPGLGKTWIEKYTDDVFPKDFIVIRGKKSKVPKYYSRSYELTNPKEYATIRGNRVHAQRHSEHNNPDRMIAAETIQKASMTLLPRNLQTGE
ncbi:MAG: replication initiator protein [Arizlama microvirus]|nr:MAG: replication initiator protein [Arizlama microvirus]